MALLVALAVVPYLGTLDAPFQFDDFPNIVSNPLITDFSYLADQHKGSAINVKAGPFTYRRIVGYLSFAMNYRLHGLEVRGYHIANIGIHALATLAVYWLASMLLTVLTQSQSERTAWAAFAAAALFAAHPLQTQAVTYIIQRLTSMAALFYLASMCCYVKARLSAIPRWQWLWLLAATVLVALGMRTKEITFTLPFAIALVEWAFFSAPLKRRLLMLAPIAATLAIIPAVALTATEGGIAEATRLQSDLGRVEYMLTQARVIATYLRLVILPMEQNLDYDYPLYKSLAQPQVWLGMAVIALMIAAGYWMWRRGARAGSEHMRLGAFGVAFFFLALSVESSLIPIADVIFEHRMYLPLTGLCICAGAVAYAISATRRGLYIGIAVTLALALALSVVTFNRNAVWGSRIGMWKDVVAKSPNKGRPHLFLALSYQEAGLKELALEQYKLATTLDPGEPTGHNNLGSAYFTLGRMDMAAREFERAVELLPDFMEARGNLALAYIEQRRPAQALEQLRFALTLKPVDPDWYFLHMGRAHGLMGQRQEAAEAFNMAITLNPSNADAQRALQALGVRR